MRLEKYIPEPPPDRAGLVHGLTIAAVALMAALVVARYGNIPLRLEELQEYFQSPKGALWFVLVYVATCVFLLPGGVLTAAAGLIFGWKYGVLLVCLSATAGACLAFLISRYIARDWVERKLMVNPKFKEIDRAVSSHGWKIVLLARLTPVIPFRFSNYVFGVSNVRFYHFAPATLFGTLPSAAFYVYSGSVAANLADVASRKAMWKEDIGLYSAGAVLLMAILIYLSRHTWKSVVGEAEEAKP